MNPSAVLDDLSFELLLLPDSLESRLGRLSSSDRLGLLKRFLEWLQTERVRDATALAALDTPGAGGPNDVQEIKILDPISGQRAPVSKKRLMLQKMSLQLFSSFSDWDLAELTGLSLSLQHELLSTLLCVCGVQHLLADLRPDSIGALLDKQTPSGGFAFQVSQ